MAKVRTDRWTTRKIAKKSIPHPQVRRLLDAAKKD